MYFTVVPKKTNKTDYSKREWHVDVIATRGITWTMIFKTDMRLGSLLPTIHSKKCNVHLPYVKHTLNVLYELYVKRMYRAPCFNVCFYNTLYMRFEKHAFNAWYEKHAFYHPLKSLSLHITTHALNWLFSRNVCLTHILVNVCFTKRTFYVRYSTYVKRALMNVC